MYIYITTMAFCNDYDIYGGWTKLKGKKTGFFHTQKINNRWWLIDPLGNAFISKGVNHVSWWADTVKDKNFSRYYETVKTKYNDDKDFWAKTATDRLKSWGFNTIGAWGKPETFKYMPYTIELGLWPTRDIFSAEFEHRVLNRVKEVCPSRTQDPNLIGYYLMNEYPWWNDHLALYLSLDKVQPGKTKIVEFLKKRYKNNIKKFNSAYSTNYSTFQDLLDVKELPRDKIAYKKDKLEFIRFFAEEYFKKITNTIRQYDSNHMILGIRSVAGIEPQEVFTVAKNYIDVFSINHYDFVSKTKLYDIYATTQKPIIFTEFSFKAVDSGLPNTKGAGTPLNTQEERAKGFEKYVKDIMSLSFVVGYHWFEYCDQPFEGREPDGENSNYGVVNIKDEVYKILAEKMKEVNEGIYDYAFKTRAVEKN